MNPWDSQGNQVTDSDGIYHCVRVCGGGGYQQGYVLQHLAINQTFPEVKKVTLGCDLYNGTITGETAVCLNAESCCVAGHSGPSVLIPNFQGWARREDGITPTLKTTQSGGNSIPSVVYSIEGNIVDRVSRKNGKGWCEGVSPTLNTQDKHAVCFGISRSALKGGMNAGGMPIEENVQPVITANGCGAVCYDARGNGDGSVIPTLTGDHQNRITDYTAIVVEQIEDGKDGSK